MTILEASGKQEPEAKEVPAGPLEEVRAHSPPLPKPSGPTLFSSPQTPVWERLLPKGMGGGGTVAPYLLLVPTLPSASGRLLALCHHPLTVCDLPPPSPELLFALPDPQDDLEPLALAPAPAPRPPQDLIGLRLAQEKALKRQLEEEQKLKPGGVGAPSSSSSSSSSSTRPGPPQPEETIDFREEGPECETPAIFISMDDDSGLTEAALLDSSLEGPLPKVGMTTSRQQGKKTIRAPG